MYSTKNEAFHCVYYLFVFSRTEFSSYHQSPSAHTASRHVLHCNIILSICVYIYVSNNNLVYSFATHYDNNSSIKVIITISCFSMLDVWLVICPSSLTWLNIVMSTSICCCCCLSYNYHKFSGFCSSRIGADERASAACPLNYAQIFPFP